MLVLQFVQNDYKINLCEGKFRHFFMTISNIVSYKRISARIAIRRVTDMPWCPVCKNEYREGIERCAECKVVLVDSLAEDDSTENADRLRQEKMARLQAMYAEQLRRQEGGEEENAEDEEIRSYHPYQNSAAKAEDNKSSAYILLCMGIAGFICVLLIFIGVIPLYQNESTTRYLVCGVMGAMFVLFIVFGVVSMRNSRILLVKAKSEDSLLSELTKWCENNLFADQVDEGLFEEDILEEQKYFLRTDKMKAIINNKFINLDEAFLEHFVDEYYQRLFEDE